MTQPDCGLCGRPRVLRKSGNAQCTFCQNERTRQRRALRSAGLIPDRPPTIEERFWSQVQGGPVTECWLWLGYTTPSGYGRFSVGGHGASPAQAHRVAYEFLIADIPEGLQLDHLCLAPSCVNPWHLDPVTREENRRRQALHQTPRGNRRERTATAA